MHGNSSVAMATCVMMAAMHAARRPGLAVDDGFPLHGYFPPTRIERGHKPQPPPAVISGLVLVCDSILQHGCTSNAWGSNTDERGHFAPTRIEEVHHGHTRPQSLLLLLSKTPAVVIDSKVSHVSGEWIPHKATTCRKLYTS